MLDACNPQDSPHRGGPLMFSSRLHWDSPTNRLTAAREKRRHLGLPTIELTETNPTRAGFSYPLDQLTEALSRSARLPYEPSPLGLLSAREALARELSTSKSTVSPDDILLTASTSEAYSYLFKLLAAPGEAVITAVPTYPLLDHLTALESVQLIHYPLLFDGRWTLQTSEIERIETSRARALVVVHPNNPTGSFLTVAEQDAVAAVCRRHDLALISDEVFSDYALIDSDRIAGAAAERDDVLSFSLGGLSKSAGLPHWKLAWIRVGGPAAARRKALEALELIADSYLSVATPVQAALPDLLALGRGIRSQIFERVTTNLSFLATLAAGSGKFAILSVEGGWSAVLRVPRVRSDEELTIELLESAGVSVQPGYLFDFPGDGYLVLSLLAVCAEFAEGVRRLKDYIEALP
jgi:alanine-synthesizing transaminase